MVVTVIYFVPAEVLPTVLSDLRLCLYAVFVWIPCHNFFHVFQIEGVDPDNARVMVKLAIGSKTVTISQYAVKLVFRKEYEKYSKDLSK